jgi:hypothetical protein
MHFLDLNDIIQQYPRPLAINTLDENLPSPASGILCSVKLFNDDQPGKVPTTDLFSLRHNAKFLLFHPVACPIFKAG